MGRGSGALPQNRPGVCRRPPPSSLCPAVRRSHAIGETVVLHVVRGIGGDSQETMHDIKITLEQEAGRSSSGGGGGGAGQ